MQGSVCRAATSNHVGVAHELTNCDEEVGERHARTALTQIAAIYDYVLLYMSRCVTSRSGATSIAYTSGKHVT